MPRIEPRTHAPTDLDPRVTRTAGFSFAFTFDSEAFGRQETGGVSVSVFRAALRAEGTPVSSRDLVACPDEPIYTDVTICDYSSSRTPSAEQARAACTRLVLLGQAAGSEVLLFEEPAELADVVRAVGKIHEYPHHLHCEHIQRSSVDHTSHRLVKEPQCREPPSKSLSSHFAELATRSNSLCCAART